MRKKLIAVALSLALIGMTGAHVTADAGSGPVVADHGVSEDLSSDLFSDGPPKYDDGGTNNTLSQSVTASEGPPKYDDGGTNSTF